MFTPGFKLQSLHSVVFFSPQNAYVYLTKTNKLDILNIIEKFWHIPLLHSHSCYRVTARVFSIIKSFIMCISLKAVVKMQSPEVRVSKCFPQVSHFLGPILFLLYANDMSQNVSQSFVHIFPDVASVYKRTPKV